MTSQKNLSKSKSNYRNYENNTNYSEMQIGNDIYVSGEKDIQTAERK